MVKILGEAPVDLAEVLRRVGPRAVVALAGEEHAAEAACARARVPDRRFCCDESAVRFMGSQAAARHILLPCMCCAAAAGITVCQQRP